MDLEKIKESDLMGRFFIWGLEDKGLTGYYNVIKHLQPLFKKLQTQEFISGFFANRFLNKHIFGGKTFLFDSVRLSYFVPVELISTAITNIKNYLDENKLIESSFRECPHQDSISLKFRKFLFLNTLIGLDIMNSPDARPLIATYRFQIFPADKPVRTHLEPTFKRDSVTYQSLSNENKSSYWSDFGFIDEHGNIWAHHLVNLILGFDVDLYSRGEPYSIPRINKEILEPNGAPLIPEDWEPLT